MELIPSTAESFYSQYTDTARTEGHKERHKEKERKRLEGRMKKWKNWVQKHSRRDWAAVSQRYSAFLKSICPESQSKLKGLVFTTLISIIFSCIFYFVTFSGREILQGGDFFGNSLENTHSSLMCSLEILFRKWVSETPYLWLCYRQGAKNTFHELLNG